LTFPERIYTEHEVAEARDLIAKGYKHNLTVYGSSDFKKKVKKALDLVKIAGYYDFLRTYIRSIREIDGLTQLRQAEASIWANDYAVRNPVDASSTFVQKANHMREYIEGKLYYGGAAEKRSYEQRMRFLQTLKEKTKEKEIAEECNRLFKMWNEGFLVY